MLKSQAERSQHFYPGETSMRQYDLVMKFSFVAGVLLLAACGQGGATSDASGDPAIGAVIEARQKALKDTGGAFKAISDQLKADSPDMARIKAAAASVPTLTDSMADWFPVGSGPESGFETEALPAIWENKDDFLTKVSNFQEAAANLNAAAMGGDAAAISAAFRNTGGTCKACHDEYRLDD
jgi:cytochrome c556